MPILQLISIPKLIDSDTPFDVDDDVQLVCKYLQAFKTGVIDRQYQEGGPLVKFSGRDRLSDTTCHELLKEYIMPKHAAESKLTQKLFIQ